MSVSRIVFAPPSLIWLFGCSQILFLGGWRRGQKSSVFGTGLVEVAVQWVRHQDSKQRWKKIQTKHPVEKEKNRKKLLKE